MEIISVQSFFFRSDISGFSLGSLVTGLTIRG